MSEGMMNNRSSILSLAMYVAVAGTLVGGIGVALTVVASTVVSHEAVARAKTPFEIQLESAREVREALAKPIPAPQPLPQITAKLEKPVAKVAATRPLSPKRNTEVAMRQSRQAFASIDPPAQPQSFFEFMAFGPRR
jgi:hypothetical protein